MIERRYSLRQAAVALGIERRTLKLWLETELGMVFPRLVRGSKFLLREADLEAAIRKHAPAVDWRRMRGPQSQRSRAA